MPIYEYICRKCGLRNSFLVYPWEDERLSCKRCGSGDMQKIISKFAKLRSDEQRIESTVEDAMRSVDLNNPDSIKSWMRKTLKDYQDEIGSDVDIDEAVESISEEIGKGEGEESEAGSQSEDY